MSAGMTYLVKISDVDNPEIFKICLDYWHYLSHDLYVSECQRAPRKESVRCVSDAYVCDLFVGFFLSFVWGCGEHSVILTSS